MLFQLIFKIWNKDWSGGHLRPIQISGGGFSVSPLNLEQNKASRLTVGALDAFPVDF